MSWFGIAATSTSTAERRIIAQTIPETPSGAGAAVIVTAAAGLATGGLKTPGTPSPGRWGVGLEAFAGRDFGFCFDVCFWLGAFGEREGAGLVEGEGPRFG